MPAKRKFNYKEVYLFCKEWGIEDTMEHFGISASMLRTIINVGDEILDSKPVPKNAKTIEEFSPRELMQELARRGYEGKLAFKQTIDIQNF